MAWREGGMGESKQPYDLKNPEEAKSYLENLGIEYRFQCIHEKLPDGCHRLASFVESCERNEAKARKLYKENCDNHKYGLSCFKYGHYNMLGTAGVKNFQEALKYYQVGCEASHPGSCHNAGLLYHSGKLTNRKPDFTKAMNYLSKGCELKDMNSCYYLSSYYLTGKAGIAKDLTKAFQYAKTSCNGGYMKACVNVSIMYKRGDGVQQNTERSEFYEARAKQMLDEQSVPKEQMKFGE